MRTVDELIADLEAQRDLGRGGWPVRMLVVRSTGEWEPGFVAGYPEGVDAVMVMCLPTPAKKGRRG